MGSKWRKAKLALGLNTCLYVPKTKDDPSPPSSSSSLWRTLSDAVSLSPASSRPTTSTSPSSGLRFSRSSSKSLSEKTCAICLTAMKPGQGNAIFMAECSHSFHFKCITSNVKHGNRKCPICRSKWKEIPLQSPNSKPRINLLGLSRDDACMAVPRLVPPPQPDRNPQLSSLFHASEPSLFDDDEVLDPQYDSAAKTADSDESSVTGVLEVKTYLEVSEVSRTVSHNDFAVLINLKAPSTKPIFSEASRPLSRASVDLVTVLDVSGSMAGTKLALLKRAMGFVIQNLGPSDRLSVIAFSSSARRLFPLRRMTESGKHEALQAVNTLVANGGTNIAAGLRKAAEVIKDRKCKNPVSSIILLSDGQDTYIVSSPLGRSCSRTPDYKSLLPVSIQQINATDAQIPVHAFGFGSDHDAAAMHAISEISGGTFSFIEAESIIQDAFAQCIGGLLSVVVQEVSVEVNCVHPSLKIGSIIAGNYRVKTSVDMRTGFISVGDLYAEEERNFLVNVDIPVVETSGEMSLLNVRCVYKDPITKETVALEDAGEVEILRPEVTARREPVVSMEVDRQKIRSRAAQAISEARVLAERGELSGAVSLLENCCRVLSETVSAKAGDEIYTALCAELRETQERMASRQVYETSGRAYVLSGLSSHSWQRATARGDLSDGTRILRTYQTPSMVDMVNLSQTMVFGNPNSNRDPTPQRQLGQSRSLPAPPRQR